MAVATASADERREGIEGPGALARRGIDRHQRDVDHRRQVNARAGKGLQAHGPIVERLYVMPLFHEMVERLRAFLILDLLFGVVVIYLVSRVISMCADGFLAVLIFLLIWPLIRS